jgi:acetyl esterase/lipase
MRRARILLEAIGVVGTAQARMLVRRLRHGPQRPSWSLQTEAAVTAMRAPMDHSKIRGVVWLREVTSLLPVRSPQRTQVRVRDVRFGDVRCVECTPLADPTPSRTVFHIHGGGYVIGSPEMSLDAIVRIAVGAGARVVAADYRLAPEHRFPAALDDCVAALRALLREVDPSRVALAGDSAGGALCVATLCSLRDAGERLPAAAALFCPWTDPLADGGSMISNEPFDFGDRALLVGWARDYAGDAASDPRVTVLDANLAGLPPLLIQAGDAEILRDQILAFAERARKAGVDVTLHVEPDMFHDWQVQAGIVPAGVPALEDAIRFLRERLA